MTKLTKAMRRALESLPWEYNRETNESGLQSNGVGKSTLQALFVADLASYAEYANGRFWQITDAGRRALTEQEADNAQR